VKPLSDVRVRKAIAHAIDKRAIIEHVLGGFGENLDSLVPKGYFGHTEEGLPRHEFDLKKAKGLLAEAGYPQGFEVTMDTWNSMLYLPIATVLQGQMEKAGIKLKLEVTDQPSFVKKIGNATAESSIYMPVRVPDADIPLTNVFHSAGFSPGTNLMR
jgi:peptide/nickel transport system substrate-binding protein